ncbi:MAG TPA: ABC transporter substrate-binding protein [Terriglobales bacterium]|nr:ABC transporter substrate-binding protein [Terriglobales bacterium]
MERIQPQEQGLRDGLEELGYVRGENLIFTRLKEAGYDQLRSKMLAYMQRQNIDLVIALGTKEASVAMKVTKTIPIVFLPAADPVNSGFVKSLARPQTNLTGLTFFTGPENVGKQLQVFDRVVPSLHQVTVLIDGSKESWGNGRLPSGFRGVASQLGIDITEAPVSTLADATQAVENLRSASREQGIFVLCSSLFKDLKEVAAAAIEQKRPLFGCNAFQVAEQDVLLSYAPDLYSLGYRGAWFVDRILKGAQPQNLPVETPRKFELVINGKVAEQIGLKIPSNVLRLADRIFK